MDGMAAAKIVKDFPAPHPHTVAHLHQHTAKPTPHSPFDWRPLVEKLKRKHRQRMGKLKKKLLAAHKLANSAMHKAQQAQLEASKVMTCVSMNST